MPTLAIKTIKNRRNASGNISIYISLTFKREIRYIPTGFEIYDEAEFEDGNVCYRRDAAILNKRLAFILNEYKSKLKRIDTKKFSTCSQLKEALTKSHTEILQLRCKQVNIQERTKKYPRRKTSWTLQ